MVSMKPINGLFITMAVSLVFPLSGFSQGIAPRPVEPRPAQPAQVSQEVQEYQQLPRTGPVARRLSAFQAFVERYPGTQLSLRVIRDAAAFFILEDSGSDYESLGRCADWIGRHLDSPAFAWARYRQASESLAIDRIETQVLYARVLASHADAVSARGDHTRSRDAFDRALKALNEAQTEWDTRPGSLQSRSDLAEELEFTRAWCLHGKGNYRDALRAYVSFMERHPSSDFMPGALRNSSLCLEVLDPQGSQQRIQRYRQMLAEEYSGSPEAASLRSQ